MTITLRPARKEDLAAIWGILEEAIQKRQSENSTQWQDGYPNQEVILLDIEKEHGFVATSEDGSIVGYMAFIPDVDPAYEVEGIEWLSNSPYGVVHRLAVSQRKKVKSLGTWMMVQAENLCKQENRQSLKVDTNFDNMAMLQLLKNLGYIQCGVVKMRGEERLAFEKRL